ncbi:MAG: Purine nucleoside phosphorylase [Myxococcaceae bacterium]|nr:Purine nucleoside phosphorylase [Myxococcaceae bacterium]
MSNPDSSTSLAHRIDETVKAIRARVSETPRVGIVLGSGLGAFGDSLDELEKIPYGELPHLPTSKVVGHAGNFCFGRVGQVRVACMQGRVHMYEGHDVTSVVHGVRTMARLGVKAVLVTNAAGGLDPSWSPGDLMLVTDHLNLTGTTPLLGPNDASLGPRFPDMSHAYDRTLAAALRDVARAARIPLREGIYAGLLGPSYETPAEVRMLRGLGAHAVGMSTVTEVLALRHMGVPVGALSCITNLAAGILDQPLDHREVEETARAKRDDLLTLLRGWIFAAGAQA